MRVKAYNAASVESKITAAQWRGLVLLVLSVCINYVDRGNLSLAAPALSAELSLTPTQLGMLLSSFFWTYAGAQIMGVGWIVDRFDVRWIYGLGFFLWSAATSVTGFASGFAALFALRLLLGVGESVAYPSYSKIIAMHFPEHHRGVANSLVDAGSKAGPAIGTMVGGLLMARFGWRVFFIATGAASLLWIVPWAIWAPQDKSRAVTRRQPGPSLRQIIRRREAWGTFVGLFCANYAWYFLVTWLPFYLIKERHYSMRMMALFGSLPYWGIAAASVTGGWISDRLIARGGRPTRIRKMFVIGGLLVSTLMVPAALMPSPIVSMALLIAACLSFGMFTSNLWAITQTLAGAEAAGKWTSIQNGIGNLGGVVAPIVTGMIVEKTGVFLLAFVAASANLVVTALLYSFVVGPVKPLAWREPLHKPGAVPN